MTSLGSLTAYGNESPYNSNTNNHSVESQHNSNTNNHRGSLLRQRSIAKRHGKGNHNNIGGTSPSNLNKGNKYNLKRRLSKLMGNVGLRPISKRKNSAANKINNLSLTGGRRRRKTKKRKRRTKRRTKHRTKRRTKRKRRTKKRR